MKREREAFMRETGVPRRVLTMAIAMADIQNRRPMHEETQVKLCDICLAVMRETKTKDAAETVAMMRAVEKTERFRRKVRKEIRLHGASVLSVIDWLGRGVGEISSDVLTV